MKELLMFRKHTLLATLATLAFWASCGFAMNPGEQELDSRLPAPAANRPETEETPPVPSAASAPHDQACSHSDDSDDSGLEFTPAALAYTLSSKSQEDFRLAKAEEVSKDTLPNLFSRILLNDLNMIMCACNCERLFSETMKKSGHPNDFKATEDGIRDEIRKYISEFGPVVRNAKSSRDVMKLKIGGCLPEDDGNYTCAKGTYEDS